MPELIDEHYRALRKATDTWQRTYINQDSGGSGTLDDPATSLTLGQPEAPTARTPQAGEGETLAPTFQPVEGEFTSEPPLSKLGKALGQKGKELAAAIHPGIVTAARALGLDETQADTMATGLTEFIAGLPGPDASDEGAGLETGLAALPAVGMAIKGVKIAKKVAPGLRGIQEPLEASFTTESGLDVVLKREFQGKYGIHTKDGERIGSISYGPRADGETWKVSGVEVSPQYQRQGVASGAYDFLEQHVIKGRFEDAGSQTQAGQAFRAGRATKQEKFTATLGGLSPEDLNKIKEKTASFEQGLKTFNKEFSEQRRGVRTDQQVLADSISPDAMTVEHFLDLKPGSIAKDSDVVKIKKMFKDLAEPVRMLAKRAAENPRDTQALMALLEQIPQVRQGLLKLSGVYAETGRSQRLLSSKLPIEHAPAAASEERVRISDPYIQQWLDFFQQQDELDKMGAPAVTIEKVVSALAELKTPEQVIGMLKAMDKPTKFDMFIEYWINGLLSGPQTHATNMISNAATQALGIPERAVAAFFSRSVRPSETTAMIGGVVESFGDAMKLAWQAFKKEEAQFGLAKMEDPRRAITADALELTGVPGRAVDLLGSMVRLPGRALLAEDDFFKGIAFRAELRALARRESIKRVTEAQLSGSDARAQMEFIEKNILDHPEQFPSIMEDAQKYAAYVTFTKDLGTTGQKWQAALSTPIGRIIAPFVRTPINIFKYAGERTPFALASRAVRDEIAAGGERRALALAKISLGSMMMAYAASKAAEGSITGGGPADPDLLREKRDTGWQSYSVKVGNTYYRYGRFEPIGTVLGAAADMADLMGQLSEDDAAELASAVVVALSRNISEKTFVKGMAGTLDAITSRDIHKVEHFFSKELPTLIPFSAMSSQLARQTDPTLRQVSPDHSYELMDRELKFILDSFKAKVPGYSKDIPPRRNLFGEPILLEGGLGPDMISPIYTTKEKTAAVSREIVRLGLSPDLPSKQIDGVPLSNEEYDAYQVLAGSKPIMGDLNLRQRLEEELKSDIYKNASAGPDGGKADRIRSWVSIYRQQAATIMKDADLSKQYLGKDFPALRSQIELKREQVMQKFNAPVGAR